MYQKAADVVYWPKMISHLAGGGVLGDKAKEGEHGQAPVLQLLELVLF